MSPPTKSSGRLVLSGVVGILEADDLLTDATELLNGNTDVFVDGSAVEHMDCAAAQILLALDRALREQGRSLTLRLGLPALAYLRRAGLSDLLIEQTL